jgi:hypothetical protein
MVLAPFGRGWPRILLASSSALSVLLAYGSLLQIFRMGYERQRGNYGPTVFETAVACGACGKVQSSHEFRKNNRLLYTAAVVGMDPNKFARSDEQARLSQFRSAIADLQLEIRNELGIQV